jgi:Acetyltransferase (GNAT) domain
MDADALWLRFAEHLACLYAAAGPTVEHGPGWLAVLSHKDHTDVNICVLLSDANRGGSEALVRLVEKADVPAVVSVPTGIDHGALVPLTAAGFVPEQLSEPLMWLDSCPPPPPGNFDVRRVRTGGELSRAIDVAAEGHGFERIMLARILGRNIDATEDVATWIAWSDEEAVSVVWLTLGSRIGVWQMNTPPRHRRRGAAREALRAALNELWDDETEGAFLWASPAGRLLYERAGFRVVAERRVWVLGGDEAASIAVGQPG